MVKNKQFLLLVNGGTTWNLQAGRVVISAVTTEGTPRLARLPRTKPQVSATN